MNLSSGRSVLIAGAGFAGLRLAWKLSRQNVEITLVDRNNFHQFPPLFYQVATSGLEPSSIVFPLRKLFQKKKNVHIRLAEIKGIRAGEHVLITDQGELKYDTLILCTGTDSSYFGKTELEHLSLPMKSVGEALNIRNSLLQNLERAVVAPPEDRSALLSVVIVGAGPTGVELSGALAELKNRILPKDYPELDFSAMKITLLELSDRTLSAMSHEASVKSKDYLLKMGVEVLTGTGLLSYDGKTATLSNGERRSTYNLIWAAGVKGNWIEGLPEKSLTPAGRVRVDRFNRVQGIDDVFALGDLACMQTELYPKGHPQVATVANEQADLLYANLVRGKSGKSWKAYEYSNKGSMATVGRHRAVVDLKGIRFQGVLAWFFWMFLHLMLILGVRNKVFIFMNWMYKYFTYDQSLRLIIKPVKK
ncbi:MAG TPA: NAD(P)/FAD-dependent oxidoreductase [Bacteroidia bacterium]|nr:NAD(P)/FAD-dependent oxidoreductase [Bacteroidia bacterium]